MTNQVKKVHKRLTKFSSAVLGVILAFFGFNHTKDATNEVDAEISHNMIDSAFSVGRAYADDSSSDGAGCSAGGGSGSSDGCADGSDGY